MLPIRRDCDVENLTDFSRYYLHSWVGWHPSDSAHIMPCYVGGMYDGQHVQLRALSKGVDGQHLLETGFSATWDDLNIRIDFGVPDIGVMPDGPTIVFCAYSTPRIAHKGYRSRQTQVSEFNNWQIRNKYAVNRSGGDRYDFTWFAFNPEYKTLEQAEDSLAKGDGVGLPLSRTLGIYSLPNFKYSLLAYKRWTVGHVINPYLIHLKREYGDYEEDIARQTGAEVIVR